MEYIKSLKDEDINTKDIPEVDFSDGTFYYYNSLNVPKKSIYLNIDTDILKWLKKDGKGYQKRLNNVIRWAIDHNCPISKL